MGRLREERRILYGLINHLIASRWMRAALRVSSFQPRTLLLATIKRFPARRTESSAVSSIHFIDRDLWFPPRRWIVAHIFTAFHGFSCLYIVRAAKRTMIIFLLFIIIKDSRRLNDIRSRIVTIVIFKRVRRKKEFPRSILFAQ